MSIFDPEDSAEFEQYMQMSRERDERQHNELCRLVETLDVPQERSTHVLWDLKAAFVNYRYSVEYKADRERSRDEIIKRLKRARRYTLAAISEVKRFRRAWENYAQHDTLEAWQYSFTKEPLDEHDLQEALPLIDRAIASFPAIANRTPNLGRKHLWGALLSIYRRCFGGNPSVSASLNNRFVHLVRSMHHIAEDPQLPTGDAIKKWLQHHLAQEAEEKCAPIDVSACGIG